MGNRRGNYGVHEMSKDMAAFPYSYGEYESTVETGMTLRDYFAAKAPEEIAWWFEGDYTELGEKPKAVLSKEDEEDGNPFARAINHDELVAWDLSASKLRYFQWRYAYADGMLKAREA
jgi:hypothetical protein